MHISLTLLDGSRITVQAGLIRLVERCDEFTRVSGDIRSVLVRETEDEIGRLISRMAALHGDPSLTDECDYAVHDLRRAVCPTSGT